MRFTEKYTLSSSFTPSTVTDTSFTVSTSLPSSRSAVKLTNGYLRLEAGISSSWIVSSTFLRLVACLDLDLLAEKRWIKDCSSRILSSFFLFWLRISCCIRRDDSYQKS